MGQIAFFGYHRIFYGTQKFYHRKVWSLSFLTHYQPSLYDHYIQSSLHLKFKNTLSSDLCRWFSYIDHQSDEGAATFLNVLISDHGYREITIRYSSKGTRSLKITVNDFSFFAQQTEFPDTGNWGTWNSITVQVFLYAGSNDIKLSAVTGASGPNIDSITIHGTCPEGISFLF